MTRETKKDNPYFTGILAAQRKSILQCMYKIDFQAECAAAAIVACLNPPACDKSAQAINNSLKATSNYSLFESNSHSNLLILCAGNHWCRHFSSLPKQGEQLCRPISV
ncbi:MAG: hypothetical protein Q4G66_00095 [bacterium]|nr:hypothetical protein [bacterium]